MLRSKKGSALIIAIVISIIASALTMLTIGVAREILHSSQMLMDKLQAQLRAENEIEKLKFSISTGRFYPNYVSIKKNSDNTAYKLYIDGRKEKLDNVTLTVYDSGSKFNVWTPLYHNVAIFLKDRGVSSSTAFAVENSLKDWYDKDDNSNLNGAESYFYKDILGTNYLPRNFNGVQSIYEWHAVRGLIDNKTFDLLKPYLILTPHWHSNLNTMDAQMLEAMLDISPDTAKELVSLRDSKGFLDTSDIKRITGRVGNLDIIGFFPSFTLDIRAVSVFNKAKADVECEINFKPDAKTPFKVLKWIE